MTAPVLSSRPTRLPEFGASPVLAARGLGEHRLALGLAALGGTWGPVDEGESFDTILHALEKGIGVFDAAPAYAESERLLGRALRQWRGPRPVVSTKVGRLPARDAHVEPTFDHTAAGMRASLVRSLETMNLPQVDLLFLHEPQYVPLSERSGVVEAMRQLQADGLARRLGLAGGHGAGWDDFLEAGVFDVVMFFRRVDPCMLDGLTEDLPRIRRASALTYGASPLHMGLLGARHDQFVRDRPEWVWGPQIDRAIQLKTLAEKHGLPLATLAHRFVFGIGELDRIVIGAGNRAELDRALDDFAAGPLPMALFEEVCRTACLS